jgi:hypothetical protein
MKKLSRKTILIIVGAIAGLCIVCIIGVGIYNSTPSGKAQHATQTQVAIAAALTQTTQPTKTPLPSATLLPDTATPTITNTPLPSSTPIPSDTPLPTDTLLPTATSTPLPQPLHFTGQGDYVLDFSKWDGNAILDVKYTGGGNFAIWSYNAAGEKLDLLVNTIGSYAGKLPLDFLSTDTTTRLQITSSGKWDITISPISPDTVNKAATPGSYKGTGDDVVSFVGQPGTATFNCQIRGNFAVWSYSTSSGKDLIVNKIAPYSGMVVLPSGTFMIVVKAPGPWSLDTK